MAFSTNLFQILLEIVCLYKEIVLMRRRQFNEILGVDSTLEWMSLDKSKEGGAGGWEVLSCDFRARRG
jgi:hypothetical protein